MRLTAFLAIALGFALQTFHMQLFGISAFVQVAPIALGLAVLLRDAERERTPWRTVAVAASLLYPDRTVINVAGDGDFLMHGQEFATAVQYGLNIIVVLLDNAMFGTIRMHQEREYPGRVSATGEPQASRGAGSAGSMQARHPHLCLARRSFPR
mgnify:CR=1 FL=1